MRIRDAIFIVSAISLNSAASAWDVFLLFIIPVGGGIPAGVLLAQSRGIGWLITMGIYLVSDIALACVFEPIMILLVYASKHYPILARMREAFQKSVGKIVASYGAKPGPFLLVVIAFGVDPMTGRAAALAAGHNFFTGWLIAILGDMIFFSIVMISTIWLNHLLGDGTWTAVIIMIAMFGIPALIRRWKKEAIHN